LATDKVLGQELARAAERNELIALDNHATIKRRVAAIQALIWQPEASIDRIVNALLESQQSSEIQAAAIHLINESNTVVAASRLVEKWSTLSPTIKNAALDVLLSKPERALVLLGAIRDQHIPATELDQARVKQLLQHRSSQVASAARELLGNLKFARRQDVVDAYRPVLKMPGDVARGKLVFGKICANCHRAENAGFEIGPNLSAMKNRGAEAILMNVLDPSREVNPQFVNYTCITNDGRSITGLLAAESATSITLRRAENQQDVVLRIDIDELRSTGLSLMPEGLEKQLDQQALADVIAYIMQLP
jgi:putative heme-binding domain-containing protein